MKVYAFPEEIPVPKLDINNLDFKEHQKKLDKAVSALADHMRKLGWTGPNTGAVYRIGHADGYAQYMVIEGVSKRQFALVHLPFDDAWDSPWSRRATKKDVLAYIGRKKLFGSSRAKASSD